MALITVDDVYSKGGVDETIVADTELIERAIAQAEDTIYNVTGQFFEPTDLDFLLDGTGTSVLRLPVPIISIDAVYMNGSDTPLPANAYVVYNRIRPVDDRRNPRIAMNRSSYYDSSNVYAGHRGGSMTFLRGEQNQRVVGTFGYCEADGQSPPPLIIRAALMLVAQYLSTPNAESGSGATGGGSGGGQSYQQGPIVEEQTDQHRIRYADIAASAVLAAGGGAIPGALTGSARVDEILRMFKAPIGISFAIGGR